MTGSEFLEPFERLLAEHFAPATLRAIAAGGDWNAQRCAVENSGFLDALAPDGVGLTLAEAAPLLMALGRHAAPVALGEAMLERGGAHGPGAAALARAAAIAGAAGRVLELTTAYATDRSQFGKPIGRQQAVQQTLAVMAEDVVAVRLAVELACAGGLPLTEERVALAKAIAAEAAPRIADTAHAVHGAIGISAEYDLQLYTGTLRRWRLESGSEGLWQARLGAALLNRDDEALDWVRLTLF